MQVDQYYAGKQNHNWCIIRNNWGVLSPLLWGLVVDDLWGLNDDGYYSVGYADDIAVLINGKFLSTVSEHLQTWSNDGVKEQSFPSILIRRYLCHFPCYSIDNSLLRFVTGKSTISIVAVVPRWATYKTRYSIVAYRDFLLGNDHKANSETVPATRQ
jgi:hypothetical protein